MADTDEPATDAKKTAADQPRTKDSPAKSEVARGNVHSANHDEPELPTPPPLAN